METLLSSAAAGVVAAAIVTGIVAYITNTKTLRQNGPLVAAQTEGASQKALNDAVVTLQAENTRLTNRANASDTRVEQAEKRARDAEQRADDADQRVSGLETRFAELERTVAQDRESNRRLRQHHVAVNRWFDTYWRAEDHDPTIPPPPVLYEPDGAA